MIRSGGLGIFSPASERPAAPPQRKRVEEGFVKETISKAEEYLASSEGFVNGIPYDKETIEGLLDVAREQLRGIIGSTPSSQLSYQEQLDSLIKKVREANFPVIQWR